MKVILLKDLTNLGKRGDIVNVAEGYARNYLFPKKLAEQATEGGIKQVEQQKQAEEKKKKKERELALNMAEKLSKAQIVLNVRAGEQGKLFGSITSKDISQALKKQYKINVDKRKIELAEPIKSIGEYDVMIKLAPEIDTKLRLKVTEG
ncbi:MAG: 50S ribosomal protein L9 [Thermoanaerobacterales bacterium]|nr:50S ribosomal protein L9 [Thermoanaerobacterales bacterium]